VVGGTALVTRGREMFPVAAGGHVAIGLGDVHRVENPGPDELVFIEVRHGERLDENDIERIEEDYGSSDGP
jgi:mannose-1-phosphate guanylyltransferase/mannose-6-phosphate isomerase